MILQKTATQYQIPSDLSLLDAYEGYLFMDEGKHLYEKLCKIDGVSDVDYNAWIGEYIIFTIQTDYDNDWTHNEIVITIEKHLETASEQLPILSK